MAITWGGIAPASGNQGRLGYEISKSGSTTTVIIYIQCKWAVVDTSNTFSFSLTGGGSTSGARTVNVTSQTAWSNSNIVRLASLSTNSATFSFSASIKGIEQFGTGTTLSVSGSGSNWSNVGGTSVRVVDNGDNTVTVSCTVGASGINNAATNCHLYWTTNGSNPVSGNGNLIVTNKSAGQYYSTTMPISKACTFKVMAYTIGARNNTAGPTTSCYLRCYAKPSTPTNVTLTYTGTRPTQKTITSFKWTASTAANADSPIQGYIFSIWKNGSAISGINLQNLSSTEMVVGAGTTSFNFSADFKSKFKAKDTIQMRLVAYSKNGKGTVLRSNIAYSDVTTIQNNGTVRIRVGGVWKEGQVYVRVNGSWKEASGIYTKTAGAWHQSV